MMLREKLRRLATRALLIKLFILFIVLWICFMWSLFRVSKDNPLNHQPLEEVGRKASVTLRPSDEGLQTTRVEEDGQGRHEGLQTARVEEDGHGRQSVKEIQFLSPPHPIPDWRTPVRYDVHIFYYPWYGNPTSDGRYLHWNHDLLPHWDPKVQKKWPTGHHEPPKDIGSTFYPRLGPYSSADPSAVLQHMQEIRYAGIGVVVMTWYPPEQRDASGLPEERRTTLILDAAHRFDLKVTFHIEPYPGRDAGSLHANLQYIIQTYGSHPAFYRKLHKGVRLPVYYVYDSYLNPAENWQQLLLPGGNFSVRNTAYDGVFLGLLVEKDHLLWLKNSGFDGAYTYFASKFFTVHSNWDHWNQTALSARASGLLFAPSVGPGYEDTRVRPWNGQNTRGRENGRYYQRSFRAAINAAPDIISITSYNEWHEGTQIEPAVPTVSYRDYLPNEPMYYLKLTQKLIREFTDKKVEQQ